MDILSQSNEQILDLLVSKIRVLGCEGSGCPIRALHNSPEHVPDPKMILEPVMNRNWSWLTLPLGPDATGAV
jgi:hypothetical protein